MLSVKLGLSQYCMFFMSLSLTLKKGSYKLHIWLGETGSEPPWAQTFLESWLEDQGLKTNTDIEILFIFASFSSRSQRFPVGNFPAGNVEVQWQCQAGLFPPPRQEQFYHRVLVPFCAFPTPSKMCQRLLTNLNPLG